MSSEALGHAWRYSSHRGPTFLVLIAIADIVNDANGNEFWMSLDNLAKKTRMARSTVAEAMKEIEESGWVERVKSDPGKTVRYRFVLDWEREIVWNSNPSASRIGNDETRPGAGQGGVRVADRGSPRGGHNTKTKPNETKRAVFELTKIYFDNLKGEIKPSGDMIAGQISQALKGVTVERLKILVKMVAEAGVPVTPGTLMIAQKGLDEATTGKVATPTWTAEYFDPKPYEEARKNAVPMPDYVKGMLRK